MANRWRLFVVVLLLLFGISPARAQDRHDVGVTMGYPASIGLVWHASDRVALRPELSLSGGHSESTNSDSVAAGTGISLLVYGGSRDNVRPFFSPRFTYAHSTLATDGPNGARLHSHTNSWGASGSFGAQYSPNKHFSVIGEVGFGYSQTESTPLVTTQAVTQIKASAWGTRTAVGIVLYP